MTQVTIESGRNADAATTFASATTKEKRVDWPVCYEAENLILDQIQAFLARNSFAASLSERMRAQTGTLLIDWVDYLGLPADAEPALRDAGFTEDPLGENPADTRNALGHSEADLPNQGRSGIRPCGSWKGKTSAERTRIVAMNAQRSTPYFES